MPEFKGPDPDWHEGRNVVEAASAYETELAQPPDGMTREQWLESLGYSAPRKTEGKPSDSERIHENQLRNWRGWRTRGGTYD